MMYYYFENMFTLPNIWNDDADNSKLNPNIIRVHVKGKQGNTSKQHKISSCMETVIMKSKSSKAVPVVLVHF